MPPVAVPPVTASRRLAHPLRLLAVILLAILLAPLTLVVLVGMISKDRR